MKHSVVRLVRYIQQVLEQDKAPIGFLLGAGCPLSIRIGENESTMPLIPDIAGLTRAVADNIAATSEKAFNTIVDELGEGGCQVPNIEKILSHVRSLKQVVGSARLFDLGREDLEELEAAICRDIVNCVNRSLPSTVGPYHQLARWIVSTHRAFPVSLFTTNYDLLIEQALEETGVAYFDGFVGSRKPFMDVQAMEDDSLPARWARLWKLHGSVNWHYDGQTVWRSETSERALVYPSHLKYEQSRRMPYLAMMDRLRSFLKQPGAMLITCGFSFGDEHINEILVQALKGNALATIFALQYGTLGECNSAVDLAKACPNLVVLTSDGGVIGARVGEWADCAPDQIGDIADVCDSAPMAPDSDAAPVALRIGDFARLGRLLESLSARVRVVGDE